jgi:murein DD-endopeptidase MepM/ murein hydrolase activator NlpD
MRDRGNPTANHLDHVHVTTYGNAAKRGSMAAADWGADRAVSPVEHYTISARFGQVGSWARYHTGLDFGAAIGKPVRAVLVWLGLLLPTRFAASRARGFRTRLTR